MGRLSGTLGRGGKKSHSFFRKISLATEWRRQFSGSRRPVSLEAMAEPMRNVMVDSRGAGEVQVVFWKQR